MNSFCAAPVDWRRNGRGLTLIEMMVVLFIMAVLFSIGFTLVPHFKEKSLSDRAAADLIVIQHGLELYRARFGDYPRVSLESATTGNAPASPNAYLFNALNGRFGPAHDLIDAPSMLNNALLTLERNELPQHGVEPLAYVDNQILDPWGEPYIYDYRPSDSDWEQFGYELYSAGGDGKSGTEDDIWAK